MALADFIPAGTPIVGGPANPSQMQTVQRVPNVTPTANTPLSTTGSFLDQLQESAGLLSNQVANVGNYTPRFASDYITTPFGEPIAKNQYVGNDFLMPNLTGASYNPRGFNPIQGGQFNFGNLGTYNPGAFNQFYQAPMTSPAMAATTTTRASEGDGRERLGGFLSRNNLRSDLLNNRFVDIPEKYETTVPGLLGILDSIIGNVPREVAVDRIMRDIDASKDFGVNKFGLGTSYKGSSGIDRDPADMTSFGTPTTGPAARDTDLGKGGNRSGGGGFGGDNTGGRDASGVGGTGGRRGGAGPN